MSLPMLRDLAAIQATSGGKAVAPRGRTTRRLPGTLNQMEQRYATYLGQLVSRGELAAWWFEPLKFRLADKSYYAPDFLVQRPDGALEIHETKGFLEDDAAVKLRVTSEMYWQFPVFLVREKPRNVWHRMQVGR